MSRGAANPEKLASNQHHEDGEGGQEIEPTSLQLGPAKAPKATNEKVITREIMGL
jgi:hypothetical protein